MVLKVDILYIANCSEWQVAAGLVKQVLADLNLVAEINTRMIENDHQALQIYFVDSPTIRVNGSDLFPVAGATTGLRLRSYPTEEGLLGHPTYAMLYEALSHYIKQE